MTSRFPTNLPGIIELLATIALTSIATFAQAGPIPVNTFLQFSFGEAGTPAVGCDPADPAGAFCIPSGGTATSFLDGPPWTFSSSAATSLIVTDAFESGDRFEIFDFGISLGLTSPPGSPVDCNDDPIFCLADPNMSHGTFALGAGSHSLTITPTLAPSGSGSGYLMVVAQATEVAEPAALWLLLFAGFGGVVSRGFVRSQQ